MARTKISEFSATAADNTDIDSIDIAEGCAPSGINNAIRELMAQLKDFQTGAGGDSFTTANLAYTGTLTGGTGVINIGSGQVYKDASGNVGIGTASPARKLHVSGGSFQVDHDYSVSGTSFRILNDATPANGVNLVAEYYGSGAYGPIKFTTSNTERMRLDASGNLGLGVTPSAWNSNSKAFQVSTAATFWGLSNNQAYVGSNSFYDTGGSFKYITTDSASQYRQWQGAHAWFTAPSGTAGNAITFTQAMTLDANGKLEISTGEARLDLKATNASGRTFNLYSGGGGNVGAGTFAICEGGATQRFLIVGGGTGESARIDASGNLLVGTTTAGFSNSSGFSVNAPSAATYISIGHVNGTASGSAYAGFPYNGGTIGSITQNGTTAVAYNTTSDYRLKENVAPLTGALARVAALKPCTYTWKSAPDEIGEGFLAHELQEVCPLAVTGEKDAVNEDGSIKPQSIDTSFLVATLTAAIQELKAEFDAYKAAHP